MSDRADVRWLTSPEPSDPPASPDCPRADWARATRLIGPWRPRRNLLFPRGLRLDDTPVGQERTPREQSHQGPHPRSSAGLLLGGHAGGGWPSQRPEGQAFPEAPCKSGQQGPPEPGTGLGSAHGPWSVTVLRADTGLRAWPTPRCAGSTDRSLVQPRQQALHTGPCVCVGGGHLCRDTLVPVLGNAPQRGPRGRKTDPDTGLGF